MPATDPQPSSPEAVKAFTRALSIGDREEAARLAQTVTLPADRSLHCKDEPTALWALGAFPSLEPRRLTCNLPTLELASAFIANQGSVAKEDIAAHLPRMNPEGLLALVGACKNVKGRMSDYGASLIDLAVKYSQVEVVRALEERGEKISKKLLLPTPEQSTEMREHLYEKRSPLSDEDFFKHPFAEGFAGRLQSSFFGLTLGQPLPKGHKCPGLKKKKDRNGNVSLVAFEQYDIPGDAFEAISAELDARFGVRSIDEQDHRVWRDPGLEASLRKQMEDAGLLLSLEVKVTDQSQLTTAVSVEDVAAAFSNMFPEFEDVAVDLVDGKYEFSANKKGSEAGITLTWPENPYTLSQGFSNQFVDAVLADLRSSEEV